MSPQLQPNLIVKQLLEEWRQKQARDNREIPYAELQLGLGELGSGSSKRVQKAFWRGMHVAVATVRHGAHADRCSTAAMFSAEVANESNVDTTGRRTLHLSVKARCRCGLARRSPWKRA
jgi:hypothetical protein